ncbi:MAG TPA: hypothetical protein VIH72_01825 [Candidatus Acidoferrales bacterium]
MRKRVVMGSVAAMMLMGMVMVARAADDPISGTWKLNLAKSKFDPGPAPKSTTVTIRVENDVETFSSDGMDAAGKATHTEFTAKFGGPDVPVTGVPYADTIALKRIGPKQIIGTYKKGGKVTVTVHVVVSADGKTRRLTYDGKNLDGKAVHDDVVYDKVM